MKPDSERHLPERELSQPDSQLEMSAGKASGLQIALTALLCVVVVSIMVFALNRPGNDVTASSPPAQTAGPQTTGAAPQDQPAAPQSGGNVAGGENTAPKAPPAAANEPAQQPVPEQAKPTTDGSQR